LLIVGDHLKDVELKRTVTGTVGQIPLGDELQLVAGQPALHPIPAGLVVAGFHHCDLLG